MNPGPRDNSVLYMQHTHRSSRVWEEKNVGSLTCRRREAIVRREILDPRVVAYIEQAGFGGILRLQFNQLDWHLITALVERWRPETHTFHMGHGEMTLTLEDVEILFGLAVDGDAVTGNTNENWRNICIELLGQAPENNNELKGGRLSLAWLSRAFGPLPDEADELMIMQYARAHIMQLIGGMLFADKSGIFVHLMFLPLLRDFDIAGRFSWGSACLAWLYRQLCIAADREADMMGGCMILLQIWAWDRFPHIAPIRRGQALYGDGIQGPLAYRWNSAFDVTHFATHVVFEYRVAFDQQAQEQVVWQPYSNDVIAALPAYCMAGHEIWRARVPLICFYIVEWYFPERVVRQFGGIQDIPLEVNTDESLHKIDLRGRGAVDWANMHQVYIGAWMERRHRIIDIKPIQHTAESVTPRYIQWYRNITRRYISRFGAIDGLLVDTLVSCRQTHDVSEIHRRIDVAMEERAHQIIDLSYDGAVEGDEDEDESLNLHVRARGGAQGRARVEGRGRGRVGGRGRIGAHFP